VVVALEAELVAPAVESVALVAELALAVANVQ
jgi:hypothetical protein